MPEPRLLIDDKVFAGWKSVRVRRSLERVAAEFELDLTDRTLPDLNVRKIAPFAGCRLEHDGDVLISGVIDEVAPNIDATTFSLKSKGRSLTGQLVDCSCVFAKGSLGGLTLAQIAARIAEPFGVKVIDLALANERFDRVQVEQGETVFELLERLARQRAVFLTDNEDGALIIRRRSTFLQGRIEEGVNLLSGGAVLNGEDQYSNYSVKGQREGSDRDAPGISAGSSGRAVDASVPIHRPKIILSERQGSVASFKERVEHEAALRRARARRWTLTVQGWRVSGDAAWQTAEEVEVHVPSLGLEDERLLVVETAFSFSEQGELTELTVAPPEGYDLIAERTQKTVSKKSKATGWDAI